MTISTVHCTSRNAEWPTPNLFFNSLDQEFAFSLDPCATRANEKSKTFFTREQNGLLQCWETHNFFCNPPYGKPMMAWAQKCYEASLA